MMCGLKSVSNMMSKTTKIQRLKRFVKISVACCVLILLVVLGFFVKHIYTFENSNMKKWLSLSEQQQILTVKRVISDFDALENSDLLIQCITKIALLPDSERMDIRDAASLCYNGIKINSNENSDDEKK